MCSQVYVADLGNVAAARCVWSDWMLLLCSHCGRQDCYACLRLVVDGLREGEPMSAAMICVEQQRKTRKNSPRGFRLREDRARCGCCNQHAQDFLAGRLKMIKE